MVTFIQDIYPKDSAPSEQEKDKSTMQLCDAMVEKLEEAQNHLFKELDYLAERIKETKENIRTSTLILQGEVRRHFNLGSDARVLGRQINKRLEDHQNGDASSSPAEHPG